jgi:hypothetical protein
MINTRSIFYYGYEITPENNFINFDEGSGELSAELRIGSYSFAELATELETALNSAGGLTYTVTANRAARTYTVSSGSNFSLLASTGSQAANGPWALLGFSADQTGASTYTGTAAGSSYEPQCFLQDYVGTENWKQASESTVNKTASGRVELVKFGDEQFMQCNFTWITDIAQPSGGPITNNASGVSQFRTFANHLITKAPVEFMPDVATRSTFETLLLESTPISKDGTGFKLKELYDRGLVGYYESGVFVFRVVV